MPVVGPRLRSEREKRGLRLVDVAMETKVGAHHLSALEYGDFAALPDDRSVIRFVRVYAEHLGLDAEAAAAEYARELEEGRPAEVVEAAGPPGDDAGPGTDPAPGNDVPPEDDARPEDYARPEADAAPGARPIPAGREKWLGPRLYLVAAALVVVLALLGWWWLAGDSNEEATPSRSETGTGRPDATRQERSSIGVEAESAAPVLVETSTEESEEPLAPDSAPDTDRLIVREHGVGTGVVDRGLVGEGSRFVEGEQVWFWTRVSGGAAGERIRHVWIHEGRETASIPLTLGGSHWRTQSRKILTPGMTGRWAVEARDEAGRLLARSEFVCSPRP